MNTKQTPLDINQNVLRNYLTTYWKLPYEIREECKLYFKDRWTKKRIYDNLWVHLHCESIKLSVGSTQFQVSLRNAITSELLFSQGNLEETYWLSFRSHPTGDFVIIQKTRD